MINRYKQFLESNSININDICKRYKIDNYTINNDNTIDVDGDVYLQNYNLKELPIKFKNVNGSFYCHHNHLRHLHGSPIIVTGNFHCEENQLKSLVGCPNKVGKDFYCQFNWLSTLEGSPLSVGGNFFCADNKLESLKGIPESIGNYIDCQNNNIISFDGFPELWEGEVSFFGNPIQEILNCFPIPLWSKAIYWINELGAIQNGKVVDDRMEEVKHILLNRSNI